MGSVAPRFTFENYKKHATPRRCEEFLLFFTFLLLFFNFSYKGVCPEFCVNTKSAPNDRLSLSNIHDSLISFRYSDPTIFLYHSKGNSRLK